MSYDWLYREPPPRFIAEINKYAADGLTWHGIDKLLEFEAHDPNTGVPNLVAVDSSATGYGLTKIASSFPQEMLEKIEEVVAQPDRLWVIGNALGATETFGSNKNQDSFPRLGLMNADPKTYGHKTFESALVFRHHKNRDPAQSIGKVTYAFFDNLLDKVLLLYYILKDKAPHIVARLEAGESLETSMGCFLADTRISLFDGSVKKIQDVVVGDRVLNSAGKISRVSELHQRTYRGKIYKVTPVGEHTIEATHEHPFLVLRRDEVMQGVRWKDPQDIDFSKKGWVHAQCLDKGDYLLRPIDREVLTPDYASEAAARLLGYYAAEGHIIRGRDKEPVGVEFSTHRDDPIHEEIEDLCEAFGTINMPVSWNRQNTPHGVAVQVRDSVLAELCQEHVGCGAKTKCLSPSLMQWHPAIQLEFLGAYINGDGWQDGSKWQEGSVGISTANENLARQIQSLLLRADIVSNINYIRHRAGKGFTPAGGSFEWSIWISKLYSEKLSCVSQKVSFYEGGGTSSRRRIIGDYLLIPIREVFPVSVEYVGPVYNFEVEDADEAHSYLVNGVAVHNCRCPYDVCSIAGCHKKAKNRTEYCEHLRDHPNAILPDGQKVMAHTPHPHFFDQSHVAKGADPIAKTLTVVDTPAKEAWDHRPKHFVMPGITSEMMKVAMQARQHVLDEVGDAGFSAAERGSREGFLYFKHAGKEDDVESEEHRKGMHPKKPSKEDVHEACEALGIADWSEQGEPRVSLEAARKLRDYFGSSGASLEDWHEGLQVELEHGDKYEGSDITNNHPILVAQIVRAHLKESPLYYKELKKMEAKLEKMKGEKIATSSHARSSEPTSEPRIGDRVKVQLEDRIKMDSHQIVPMGDIPGTLNKADGDPWDAIPIDQPLSRTRGTVAGKVVGKIEVPDGNHKLVVKTKPGVLSKRQKEDLQSYVAARSVWQKGLEIEVPGVKDVQVKVASLKDILRKLSEESKRATITKQVPGMASALNTVVEQASKRIKKLDKVSSFAHTFLPLLEAVEPGIHPDFLSKLAEAFTPSEILSSLYSEGIVLRPHELQGIIKASERTPYDVVLDPRRVRPGIITKLSRDLLVMRSCLPENLYQRSMAMVGSLTKQGAVPLKISPEQLMRMLQELQAQQAQGAQRVHQTSPDYSYLPPRVARSVQEDMLMQMYQTNLGRLDPSAFSRIPTPNMGLSLTKGGSVEDFIEACRGVPSQAYLKYAHTGCGAQGDLQGWPCDSIPASHVWFQEYVVKPRSDLEKVSTILMNDPGDLLDAATIINLRFVCDVLRG